MKKLILLGLANKKLFKKLFNYDEFDIWSVAPLLFFYKKKINKIFEIHRYSEYKQDTIALVENTEHHVVLQKPNKKVKHYSLFPYKDIRRKYGDYFTSSFALMLIYAYELGYREIHIKGIEYSGSWRERIIERCNFEYWIGYLRGKGIKIEVESKYLLKSKNFYGIDNILSKIKKHDKEIRRAKKLIELNYFKIFKNKIKGKREEFKYYISYLNIALKRLDELKFMQWLE